MEEYLYKFLSEETKDIVFLFDGEENILYFNRAASVFLEYEDFEGIKIGTLFPELQEIREEWKENLQLQDTMQCSLMAYRKNNTCFHCEGKMTRFQNDRYAILLADVSKKDFLEKKIAQVEQEAQEALQVKTEFVANVTHELRTPVNGILGNTRILLEENKDENQLKTLRLIERGCNDMNAMINNILDFSKLETGKFVLEKRKFDFRAMLDYVKSTHQPKITEKGLEFFVTISPEIPQYIIADELRITQVLNNLLSNACKFTSVGKISMEVLKTAQTGRQIELFFVVVDTGIGIDKVNKDKLFQSFSQVDASISRKYGGTGLGLNISQQLIQLMNGSIRVESQKNKGSTFSFHIWVEIPEDEEVSNKVDSYVQHTEENQKEDQLLQFGTKTNIDELTNKLSKLILCIEMENWEKAEEFMDSIRQLTSNGNHEIKTAVLKLKMAVQKNDYEKSISSYNTVMEYINTRV